MPVRQMLVDETHNCIVVEGRSVKVPHGILLLAYYMLRNPRRWMSACDIQRDLWRAGRFSEDTIRSMLEVLAERLNQVCPFKLIACGPKGYLLRYWGDQPEFLVKDEEPGLSAEYLTVGGVQLSLITSEVVIDGQGERLTAKELKLLRHLMQWPNSFATVRELRQAVWELDDENKSAVASCILKIRDKLGLESWRIERVRCQGYRFLEEARKP